MLDFYNKSVLMKNQRNSNIIIFFFQILGTEETSFSMLSGPRKKKAGQTNWNIALQKLNVTSYFQPEDPIVVVR